MEALLNPIIPSNHHLQKAFYSLTKKDLPIIVMITSYPPRECGIATYANDLYISLNNKFYDSFTIHICAVEKENNTHSYTSEVKFKLNTNKSADYIELATQLNANKEIQLIIIQHEFGFYYGNDNDYQQFVKLLQKPIIIELHTVLGEPSEAMKKYLQIMLESAAKTIVMTQHAAKLLKNDYEIPADKISIISHGTHLVKHTDKIRLKKKYGLSGNKILSTFGLLSSGKSIETTLNALVNIVKKEPTVLFLIIGITHPEVVKIEGEAYRESLQKEITLLNLDHHVLFINQFLELPELLNYLQLTDIYLFTSNNPNQAVSGTFSYAISCGCPIIATAIPHALEVLSNNTGIIVDFNDSQQLSTAILDLLGNEIKRDEYSINGIHKLASTAWENSALNHASLFMKHISTLLEVNFSIPIINLYHIKKLTTNFGIIQFSILNKPNLSSGYTLDDNARAMIAISMLFKKTRQFEYLYLIEIYLNFIHFCQQKDGSFLNYVNEQKKFTEENQTSNLEDANGRAIWALGYIIGLEKILPIDFINKAKSILNNAVVHLEKIHSTRAMAFIIKGLSLSIEKNKDNKIEDTILVFANRIYQMYLHESNSYWDWYENYLTYANSLLPEAMLNAWKATGEDKFKKVAIESFKFLIGQTFTSTGIHVISNKNWNNNVKDINCDLVGGEQPIDVAYTVISLSSFYDEFKSPFYIQKMKIAFDWFQGRNHLNEIIYNPCTGGCYDGLEDSYVNLNQGAESTISYLIARMTIDKYNFTII